MRLSWGVVAIILLPVCSAQIRWVKQWSYNCSLSAFNWGDDYPQCSDNGRTQQSPVDIRTATSTDGSDDSSNTRTAASELSLEIKFTSARFHAEYDLLFELRQPTTDDKQTVQIHWIEEDPPTCPTCSSSQVTKSLDLFLSRIVLHHPSEHTFNGHRFPIETQMYFTEDAHSSTETVAIAVLGIITSEEYVLPDVLELTKNMQEFTASNTGMAKEFNPASLLPSMGGFYVYNGTDTAPPCTRKMQWFVMQHTANFTAATVAGLDKHRAIFHREGQGTARNTMPPNELRVTFYPSSSELFMSGGMPAMTADQMQSYLRAKTLYPDVLTMDPAYLYSDPYDLALPSKCVTKTDRDRVFVVEPNTPPSLLNLSPDIVVIRELPAVTLPPPPLHVRTPTAQGGFHGTQSLPRQKFADWTNDRSQDTVLAMLFAKCNGGNATADELRTCATLRSMLPPTAQVFTYVPMPPLPPVPEPKFIPNNWPIHPLQLNLPASPDAPLNPYNPNSYRLTPFDRNDPLSGQDAYMHKPSKSRTPFIKPTLNLGPVYPTPDSVNADHSLGTR